MMAMLVQVGAEYGALASRNAGGNPFRDLFDRIARAVPMEYVVVGVAGLAVLYLIRKLF